MNKFLISIPIILLGYFYFHVATFVSLKVIDAQIESGSIQLGPMPNSISLFYDFRGVEKSYRDGVNLQFSKVLTKDEFESFIFNNLHDAHKNDAKPVMKEILKVAEDYQLDPFWLVSIALVESRFQLNAVSNKNARGIMQIRPDTAAHLLKVLKRDSDDQAVLASYTNYKINLDLAGFYLKKLLQNFRMDYQLATVAYNVGPNKLKSMLESNESYSDNNYLKKVNKAYAEITRDFSVVANFKIEAVSKNKQLAQN